MNGFSPRPALNHGSRFWGKVFLGIFLLAAWRAPAAEASPLRSYRPRAEAAALNSWANYIGQGPGFWSMVHAPRVTLGIRRAMMQGLTSADPWSNPLVQYLAWRHDLNPARFDFWHPRIGPMLERLFPPPTTQAPLTAQAPGALVVPPISAAPQLIPPPHMPEPSTWAISLVLIGSGIWWRHRAGRSMAVSNDQE